MSSIQIESPWDFFGLKGIRTFYFLGHILGLGVFEQFGTWKLDEVQNICEFCQFFLSDFWFKNVLIPSSPKQVPREKIS